MKTMEETLKSIIWNIERNNSKEIIIGYFNNEDKLINLITKGFKEFKDIRMSRIFHEAKKKKAKSIVIYRKSEDITMKSSNEEIVFINKVKLKGIKVNIRLVDYVLIGSEYHYISFEKSEII